MIFGDKSRRTDFPNKSIMVNLSGLGIPGNVITNFESFFHLILPNAQWRKPVQHAAITASGCRYSVLPSALLRWEH